MFLGRQVCQFRPGRDFRLGIGNPAVLAGAVHGLVDNLPKSASPTKEPRQNKLTASVITNPKSEYRNPKGLSGAQSSVLDPVEFG